MSVLDDLKKLLAAASPGPWVASPQVGFIEGPEGILFKAFLTKPRSKRDGQRRLKKQLHANTQLAALSRPLALTLVKSQEALKASVPWLDGIKAKDVARDALRMDGLKEAMKG